MARWRGFDNPFGYISTILDGIIVDINVTNHPNNMSYVYTCQDASKYADTLNDFYVNVGEEIYNNVYTKSFDLGDAAHIIPHVMGGNPTTYICDYHQTHSINQNLRMFLVGGSARSNYIVGLGYVDSSNSVDIKWQTFGFRSVSVFCLSLQINNKGKR